MSKTILKNRNFILLFVGQGISYLGDAVFEIALMWYLLQTTGSSLLMGSVMIFFMVPNLITKIFSGVLIDRVSRRKIMFLSNLFSGFLLFISAILFLLGLFTIPIIFFMSALLGFISAFFEPSQSSIIPSILTKDQLIKGNSILQLVFRLSFLVGPAISGLIMAKFGILSLIIFDAISFFIGAFCIYLIRLEEKANLQVKRLNLKIWFQEFKEGINFIIKTKVILYLIIALAWINFFFSPVGILLAPFVKKILGKSVMDFGFLNSAVSVGTLIGFVYLSIAKVKRKGFYILMGFLGAGVSIFLLGLSKNMIMIYGSIITAGVFVAFVNSPIISLMQELTEERMRGRLFSTMSIVTGSLAPLSIGIFTSIADKIPVDKLFSFLGLMVTLISISLFFVKEIRRA